MMTDQRLRLRSIAFLTAGLTAVIGLVWLTDRGGLIAWVTFLISVALLAKIWLRPSRIDLGMSIGLVTVSALTWLGVWYYVISTWETGEVVELVIQSGEDTRTARVWVLDIGGDPVIYYDAEPEVALSLLAGNPVKLRRSGEISRRIPRATEVDALPEEESSLLFEAMLAKYGERVGAADIYYLMLGRSRDRVAVVATLAED